MLTSGSFDPVLARQSIRKLNLTRRTFRDAFNTALIRHLGKHVRILTAETDVCALIRNLPGRILC